MNTSAKQIADSWMNNENVNTCRWIRKAKGRDLMLFIHYIMKAGIKAELAVDTVSACLNVNQD